MKEKKLLTKEASLIALFLACLPALLEVQLSFLRSRHTAGEEASSEY